MRPTSPWWASSGTVVRRRSDGRRDMDAAERRVPHIDPDEGRVADGSRRPLCCEKLGHKTEEALAKLGVEMKMNVQTVDAEA